VLQGSCLCGGVQFELAEAPGPLTFCHCTTCKRISGGVGTVNVGVPAEAVRIVEGRDLLRTFQPAEGSAKTFCSNCGTNLFGAGWPDSGRASVRVPTLQDFEPQPGSHIFVRSVAPWETLPEDGQDRFEIRATDHV
jgi:hypothetical protein